MDNAKRVYMEKRDHWDRELVERIAMCAEWSRVSGKPLITTECWSLVDYKDWPLLEWDWLKQLCELGVRTAAGTGTLGRHRHQQLLWAAVCRHVAGCRLASPDDKHHSLRSPEQVNGPGPQPIVGWVPSPAFDASSILGEGRAIPLLAFARPHFPYCQAAIRAAFLVMVDLPDNVTAAATSLPVGTAGYVRLKTIQLLTVDEVDQALAVTTKYRGHGQDS